MSFAQITLLGNTGRDPEMSYWPAGDAFTKFSIATSRKGKGGKEETTWWNCTAFRKLAEVINEHVHKGDMLLITGSPSLREYPKRDGGTGYSIDVTVDKFAFAGGSKKQNGGGLSVVPTDAADPDPLGEIDDIEHPF